MELAAPLKEARTFSPKAYLAKVGPERRLRSRDRRFRLTVSQDVALLAECERPHRAHPCLSHTHPNVVAVGCEIAGEVPTVVWCVGLSLHGLVPGAHDELVLALLQHRV